MSALHSCVLYNAGGGGGHGDQSALGTKYLVCMSNVTNLVINRRSRWSCACFSLYPDFLLIVYSHYSDIVLIILGTWTDGWLNVGTKQRPAGRPDRHVPAFSNTFQHLQPKTGPCARVTRLSIASAVTYADACSVSFGSDLPLLHCGLFRQFCCNSFWKLNVFNSDMLMDRVVFVEVVFIPSHQT